MLESLSDYISLFALVLLAGLGLWSFFTVSNKHHILNSKRREEAYYSFLEESEDDSENDSNDDIYIE